jgi:tryptophanyl-tRNA synthetase
MSSVKPIIFSGMQPTGIPTVGNYIGAVKHWVRLQDEYRALYCIVDSHSITVRQEPEAFRKRIKEFLALYIALGIDPEHSIIYYQSQVSAHAELAWILNCYTYVGELNRMTQFKDKSRKHADNINAGLYTYPVLMAADILLYQANAVPVGEDQKQHLELCRDIAERFNGIYGDIFTVPEPVIAEVGARIMSLQDTEKMMSKSETENMNNVILLTDPPEVIMKKCKRAVTDSDNEIRYAPDEKPGVSNLLTIYACLKDKNPADSAADFTGMGYGALKQTVGEVIIEKLTPVQTRLRELLADTAYLDKLTDENAAKARAMANATLKNVKQAIGFPV